MDFPYQIFQWLDKSSLHVSSLGSFDSSVHQTLSPTHSMEEEFRRGQPCVKAVDDEALGGGNLGVALKVRQGAILEAVGDALATDGLVLDKYRWFIELF